MDYAGALKRPTLPLIDIVRRIAGSRKYVVDAEPPELDDQKRAECGPTVFGNASEIVAAG